MKLPHSWGGRFILLACLKLALTGLIVGGWLLSDGERWRARLEAAGSAALRQPVAIAQVTPAFAWGHGLALNAVNVRVGTATALERVQLDVDPLALLRGRLGIGRAELTSGTLHAVARFGAHPALDLQATGLSLRLHGDRQQDAGQTRAAAVTGRLNGNDFTGMLALSQGTRGRLDATLTFPRYDWTPVGDPAGDAAGEPAAATAAPQPLFGYAALPWHWLTVADGALTVRVGQLAYRDHALGPAYLQADLVEGRLAATALAQPPAAAQPLEVQLAASAADRRVQLALDAPRLDPLWWSTVGGTQPLVTSPAALAVRLAGQGASPHELAQTATGRIVFAAQPGRLNTAALPRLLALALDAALGRDKVEAASLACMRADFAVAGGIASAMRSATEQTVGLGLASDLLDIAGAGQIDLGREVLALQLVAAPRLPGGAAGGLTTPVPITVAGPLAAPAITPDLTTAGQQLLGSLLRGAGRVLPSAAAALTVAKAIGQDPAPPLIIPPNPCLAPPPEPAPAADALPPLLRDQLQRALAALAPYLQALPAP